MRYVISAMQRLLAGAAVLLIFKVTFSVVIGFRDYVPPNFDADFLLGREAYFYGPYACAFYAHLIAGPTTLLVGTVLVSERFRRRCPAWHRGLGKLQIACVLLVLVPSGLWMARYAVSGAIAGIGLTLLAIATATCAALGWRTAVERRFDQHRRWMWRTYLLLCSAVVLRLIGGLASVLQLDVLWLYPSSVWMSWLLPLGVFECWRRIGTSLAISPSFNTGSMGPATPLAANRRARPRESSRNDRKKTGTRIADCLP